MAPQDEAEDKLEEMRRNIGNALKEEARERYSLGCAIFEGMSAEDRLNVTCYIFSILSDHLVDGGTYRFLIYNRMGFSPAAYCPLQVAGGLDISNALFDARRLHDKGWDIFDLPDKDLPDDGGR